MAKGIREAADLLMGLLASHCVTVQVSGGIRLGLPDEEVDTIEIVALGQPGLWEKEPDEEHWSGLEEQKRIYLEDELDKMEITGKGHYRSGKFQGHPVIVYVQGSTASFAATLLLSTGPNALTLYQKGYAARAGFCLHHTGLYLNATPPMSGLKWWRLAAPNEENIYWLLGMDYATPEGRVEAGKFVLENLEHHRIKQYSMASKSDKTKRYMVTNSGGLSGHWECDCPDWMYRRSVEIPPAHCKHIKEVVSKE